MTTQQTIDAFEAAMMEVRSDWEDREAAKELARNYNPGPRSSGGKSKFPTAYNRRQQVTQDFEAYKAFMNS
jgi:hypothetical protein